MDNETATKIAKMAQVHNDQGGRVRAIYVTPNSDAGSSGPTIVFDVDYSVQEAGSA